MALSNEDILNAIAEMSVMDVVALVEAMEEKFGVSAAAAVAAANANAHANRGVSLSILSPSGAWVAEPVAGASRRATGWNAP